MLIQLFVIYNAYRIKDFQLMNLKKFLFINYRNWLKFSIISLFFCKNVCN